MSMDIVYAFLALAAVFGFLLLLIILGHTLREPRHKAAWAQLSSMIGGIYSSRIGAMYYRYQISGNYQSVPVEIFIETHSWDDEPNTYTYHLRINAGAGSHDWIIRFRDAEVHSPGRSWDVESRDETLEQRLIQMDDIELIAKDSGSAIVQYKAEEGAMEYERSVDGDTSVPTPDEFRAQFSLLKHLSELNEKLNAS